MSEVHAMDVAAATAVLREEATEAIGVVTMSAIAFWGEPRPQDFRLVGTMGAAASIGLGVALGVRDRPVWVVDGDGSLLMQLGVVAAVGDAAPPNLLHVVIDNGIYAISGAQPVPAADWPSLLVAAGYSEAVSCETPDELRTALRRSVDGPRGVIVRCAGERPAYPPGSFLLRPAEEAARLRATLASEVAPAESVTVRD
jgi:phosphonopyruvate decarboxylase